MSRRRSGSSCRPYCGNRSAGQERRTNLAHAMSKRVFPCRAEVRSISLPTSGSLLPPRVGRATSHRGGRATVRGRSGPATSLRWSRRSRARSWARTRSWASPWRTARHPRDPDKWPWTVGLRPIVLLDGSVAPTLATVILRAAGELHRRDPFPRHAWSPPAGCWHGVLNERRRSSLATRRLAAAGNRAARDPYRCDGGHESPTRTIASTPAGQRRVQHHHVKSRPDPASASLVPLLR